MTLDTLPPILASGMKSIARKGVKQTSLRDVANGAGVSLGRVTYQYGDKKKLVQAVVCAACKQSSHQDTLDQNALHAWLKAGPRGFEDWLAAHCLTLSSDTRRLRRVRRELFLEARRDSELRTLALDWRAQDCAFTAHVLERFDLDPAAHPVLIELRQAVGDLISTSVGAPLAAALALNLCRHAARRLSGHPPPEDDWSTLLGSPSIASVVEPRPPQDSAALHVLDAAIRVAARDGVNALTFRTLAEEAGYSTSVATCRFGNRSGVLAATFSHAHHRLVARADRSTAILAGLSAYEAIVEGYIASIIHSDGSVREEFAVIDELFAAGRDPALAPLAFALTRGRGKTSYNGLKLMARDKTIVPMDGLLVTLSAVAAGSWISVEEPAERSTVLRRLAETRLRALFNITR